MLLCYLLGITGSTSFQIDQLAIGNIMGRATYLRNHQSRWRCGTKQTSRYDRILGGFVAIMGIRLDFKSQFEVMVNSALYMDRFTAFETSNTSTTCVFTESAVDFESCWINTTNVFHRRKSFWIHKFNFRNESGTLHMSPVVSRCTFERLMLMFAIETKDAFVNV